MGKILLLAIAVWLIYAILKRYSRSVGKSGTINSDPEKMVQCTHCGVHVPQHDSVAANGKYFCSEAHKLEADL
jgi:uncharacterized protein